jgi:tRNA threonylcarbamoyladenosine dehydratase
MMNRDYLVAPEAVNFQEKRAPFTVMACDLCAGVMGASRTEGFVPAWPAQG